VIKDKIVEANPLTIVTMNSDSQLDQKAQIALALIVGVPIGLIGIIFGLILSFLVARTSSGGSVYVDPTYFLPPFVAAVSSILSYSILMIVDTKISRDRIIFESTIAAAVGPAIWILLVSVLSGSFLVAIPTFIAFAIGCVFLFVPKKLQKTNPTTSHCSEEK
tara:strand:+ start:247992 stop:248480 length:489 start_codon:yes stop_codon:yes gene_type:complete